MTYIINAQTVSDYKVDIKYPKSLNLERAKQRAKVLFSKQNIKQAFIINDFGKTVFNLVK